MKRYIYLPIISCLLVATTTQAQFSKTPLYNNTPSYSNTAPNTQNKTPNEYLGENDELHLNIDEIYKYKPDSFASYIHFPDAPERPYFDEYFKGTITFTNNNFLEAVTCKNYAHKSLYFYDQNNQQIKKEIYGGLVCKDSDPIYELNILDSLTYDAQGYFTKYHQKGFENGGTGNFVTNAELIFTNTINNTGLLTRTRIDYKEYYGYNGELFLEVDFSWNNNTLVQIVLNNSGRKYRVSNLVWNKLATFNNKDFVRALLLHTIHQTPFNDEFIPKTPNAFILNFEESLIACTYEKLNSDESTDVKYNWSYSDSANTKKMRFDQVYPKAARESQDILTFDNFQNIVSYKHEVYVDDTLNNYGENCYDINYTNNRISEKLLYYKSYSPQNGTQIDTVFKTHYFYNTTSSITSSNNNGISIYPNPAKSNLFINIGDYATTTATAITIVNSIGQVVYQLEEKAPNQSLKSIDISTLPKGLYVVQVKKDKHFFTKKVLIM